MFKVIRDSFHGDSFGLLSNPSDHGSKSNQMVGKGTSVSSEFSEQLKGDELTIGLVAPPAKLMEPEKIDNLKFPSRWCVCLVVPSSRPRERRDNQ